VQENIEKKLIHKTNKLLMLEDEIAMTRTAIEKAKRDIALLEEAIVKLGLLLT
jgi:hypothetical protein